MSISKAVIMGKVVRSPEKRFTTNNTPITTFSMNISSKDGEEAIVKVVAIGKLAEKTSDTVKKDNVVLVEAKLQTSVTKTDKGVEKKGIELNAQAIEVAGEGVSSGDAAEVQDDSYNIDNEINTDDLIGEDEIPF